MKATRRERILNRSLLLGISAVITFMLANIFVSRDSSEDQHKATTSVIHTLQVLGEFDAVLAQLSEAQASQRAYILTNDESYLAPYTVATRAIGERLDALEVLCADNPLQLARLRRLRELARERVQQMDGVLVASAEQGLMAARQLLLQNAHQETMGAIRDLAGVSKGVESELLDKRLRASASTYRRTRDLNLVAGVLGLLALGAFVFLVDKDLRAREQAAAELARQRETLQVTLASIGDGVITTDRLGRVDFLNAEAEALTGWNSADAAGRTLDEVLRIVEETSREPVASPAVRALTEGIAVGLAQRTVLIAKDGQERPISDSAAPIRDAAGAVAGVVLVFRDDTEERTATNRLRDLASELFEADRRKNEFLALLAHEIRNPLAAIRNSVAVLKLAEAEPEAAVAAQGAIERQMAHLVRLVEDLLDVARISRGKLALRRERVDLREVAHQAVEASLPLCKENEHVLAVEIPATPLFVHGDPTRMTQVIGNILNNACKFTSRGGDIRLSVGLDDGHAVVRIRDNGEGIAAEHLPHVFDMFSQIDTSLERAQSGLGLGLNLVKQLVEMHGGRVAVTSEGTGRGSEFVVHFPLLVEATEAAAGAPEPAPVSSPVAPPPQEALGNSLRRILVVDDIADSADSLALLLRLRGYESSVARDGEEAVEIALRTLPDVILLDIGLPKLNGYEAARRIRQVPEGREMRLIALTGWGQLEDRKRTEEAGFDAHLVKPVEVDELMRLLERLAPRRELA